MFRLILGVLMIFILGSCTLESTVKLYSPDKFTCVTIETIDEIRYVIAGDESAIPKNDYIKLDVSKVTDLGDQVYICWLDNHGWDMVIPKSIILESKLDTSKYKFKTRLPVDENGIPTVIDYSKSNCAAFDYYSMELTPNKGAIVKVKKNYPGN